MKPIKQFLFFSLLLILASCGTKSEEAKYIPKSASTVLIMNAQTLREKMKKANVQLDTVLAKIFVNDSSDAKAKAVLKRVFDSAGINWDKNLFAYVQQKSSMLNGVTTQIAFSLGLSDAEKFKKVLAAEGKDSIAKAIQQKDKYSALYLNDNTVLSWNKERAFISYYRNDRPVQFDSVNMKFTLPDPKKEAEAVAASVEAIYTLDKSASMQELVAFNDMMKDPADAWLFSSSNGALASLSATPLNLPGIENLLKDNYSTNTIHFTEGKIEGISRLYPSPQMKSIFKKYAGPVVNTDMIKRFPGKIQGFSAASFNPELIGAILDELQVEELVGGFIRETGFTLQDFYQCIKGDITVAFGDIAMKPISSDTTVFNFSLPTGKLVMYAPVGNKQSFTKLMDSAVNRKWLQKNGNDYVPNELMEKIGLYIKANQDGILMASDSATAVAFMQASAKATIDPAILDQAKGKSVAFYMDISGIIGALRANATTPAYYDGLFSHVIATTDNFNGKAVEGKFEVVMNNKNENSLVAIIKLMTGFAADMRKSNKLVLRESDSIRNLDLMTQ